MLGCLFGTACLIGLVGMYKKHRWHGGHWRSCRPAPCSCHGGHDGCDDERSSSWSEGYDDVRREGPEGFFRGAILRSVFSRLRTTPAQEREINLALDELKHKAKDLKREWRDTREQVAGALRADDFNAEIMGAVFSQQDDVIESIRKELVGALARVHDVLDARQRDELARMLERGFHPRWA